MESGGGVGDGAGDVRAAREGPEVVGDGGVVGEGRGDEERVICGFGDWGEDEEGQGSGYGE